jgi:hypothetical protein
VLTVLSWIESGAADYLDHSMSLQNVGGAGVPSELPAAAFERLASI